MDNFLELQFEELVNISGGKGNIGSAIGECLGGMLIAAAGGPITGGAAAFVCVASGIAAYQ
ncbi:TPA: class IIb bacteriocin, lactobin A/cerein 7B family [Streptococcus pyogenes]|uniref:class IIb bacteriocin, lactobin A/cerein 7B family n=1 Tax=Streptococcus pyogenes TaxID=1314 RepID=UPI0000D750AF|nr:class IIb bacteriocin, lactobin A/cerein 7B family [Streptococcus pyogenes]ERL16727.1 class IIb bacteriocin, lactobin A/cerein 7B family [Streptococcus pyogenes GA41046]HER4545419.1 class IIb bacteriocin, lactobin A/cerein 7B family [Streptococcus pyogenes NGAS726]HER4560807.1 class IIb bacteriocin, lactobin A/cerein 7B family [Streptococcus pyogenes NGAS671]HER4625235.1 class IIb bacteriocin, lactobin A/cerein 7B family [Streptococcus pyogenes NGAS604]HER4674136.1 class IIb bacteriocin, la